MIIFLWLALMCDSPAPASAQIPNEKAAIVLTGAKGRIAAGLRLLEQGKAETLLISGVNPNMSFADLQKHGYVSREKFDCCVTLDLDARNTRQNARQSRKWLDEKNLDSFTLVTSDYHMPRSILEFKSLMPEKTIRPLCVKGDREKAKLEFAKYVATLLRLAIWKE